MCTKKYMQDCNAMDPVEYFSGINVIEQGYAESKIHKMGVSN